MIVSLLCIFFLDALRPPLRLTMTVPFSQTPFSVLSFLRALSMPWWLLLLFLLMFGWIDTTMGIDDEAYGSLYHHEHIHGHDHQSDSHSHEADGMHEDSHNHHDHHHHSNDIRNMTIVLGVLLGFCMLALCMQSLCILWNRHMMLRGGMHHPGEAADQQHRVSYCRHCHRCCPCLPFLTNLNRETYEQERESLRLLREQRRLRRQHLQAIQLDEARTNIVEIGGLGGVTMSIPSGTEVAGIATRNTVTTTTTTIVDMSADSSTTSGSAGRNNVPSVSEVRTTTVAPRQARNVVMHPPRSLPTTATAETRPTSSRQLPFAITTFSQIPGVIPNTTARSVEMNTTIRPTRGHSAVGRPLQGTTRMRASPAGDSPTGSRDRMTQQQRWDFIESVVSFHRYCPEVHKKTPEDNEESTEKEDTDIEKENQTDEMNGRDIFNKPPSDSKKPKGTTEPTQSPAGFRFPILSAFRSSTTASSSASISRARSPLPAPVMCAVCLDGFHEGDFINDTSTAVCDHRFHRECLLKWLDQHDVCPCCRRCMISPTEWQEAAAAATAAAAAAAAVSNAPTIITTTTTTTATTPETTAIDGLENANTNHNNDNNNVVDEQGDDAGELELTVSTTVQAATNDASARTSHDRASEPASESIPALPTSLGKQQDQ